MIGCPASLTMQDDGKKTQFFFTLYRTLRYAAQMMDGKGLGKQKPGLLEGIEWTWTPLTALWIPIRKPFQKPLRSWLMYSPNSPWTPLRNILSLTHILPSSPNGQLPVHTSKGGESKPLQMTSEQEQKVNLTVLRTKHTNLSIHYHPKGNKQETFSNSMILQVWQKADKLKNSSPSGNKKCGAGISIAKV